MRVFGSNDAIATATTDDLSEGLLPLHAFLEQLALASLPRIETQAWSRHCRRVR
jgi:hypothetical protein